MELLRYWTTIRSRIWLLLLFVVGSLLGTGLYTHYMVPPVYQASAKLIVNPSVPQEGAATLSWDQVNTSIRLIKTYKELILTSVIMDEVASRNASFGISAESLTRMVDVDSVNETQVMTVRVSDLSYARAAVLANSIVQVFQEKLPDIMNVNNVSVLSLAKEEAAPRPVSPNMTLNLALALFASTVVAIGLIFLLDYLDDTIKCEEDIAVHLQMPTLAVISKMAKSDWKRQAGVPPIKKQTGESTYAAVNQ